MLQTRETCQNYRPFLVCPGCCVSVCLTGHIQYHETWGITNFTELKEMIKIRDNPWNGIMIEII